MSIERPAMNQDDWNQDEDPSDPEDVNYTSHAPPSESHRSTETAYIDSPASKAHDARLAAAEAKISAAFSKLQVSYS